MNKDIAVVKDALSMFSFKQEKQMYIWRSRFVSLNGDLHLSLFSRHKNDCLPIYEKFHHVVQDVWNIGAIVDRLEWMRKKAIEDDELKNKWMYYASLDIEHFHIEMRAIMNYVAEIIYHMADDNKKGQLPKKSFRKLLNWILKKTGNRELLGEELALIVLSAERWFNKLFPVRDAIMHEGGYSLVFGEPEDGILFQVLNKRNINIVNTLSNKLIMHNDTNVIYFDRYAAILFSYLLVFLDQLAGTVQPILKGKTLNSLDQNSENYCFGFAVINRWMENLISVSDDN